MPQGFRTKYNTAVGDSIEQDPTSALATLLGIDDATGPVNVDKPFGSPSLELANLRGERETELENRTLMGTDRQAPKLLDFLRGQMAADPYTGLAAQKRAQADRDAYTQAVVTNEPSNPLAQERNRREAFEIAKTSAAHPNFNQQAFPGGTGLMGADVALRNPKLQAKFDEMTADLPPEAKATIRGIIQRDQNIPTSGTAYTKMLPFLQRAQLIDPSLDLKKYAAQQQYMNDYSKGGIYKAKTSLDTVMHHLDDFANAASAMGNTEFKPWNWLMHTGKSMTGGDPQLQKFNDTATAVEGELSNVFKATGATDQEIKAWRQNLGMAQTPEEFKANVAQLVSLINGRMEAIRKGYSDTMGEEAPDFLSPESRAIYNARSGGGMVSMVAPDGRRLSVPAAEAAALEAAGARRQ